MTVPAGVAAEAAAGERIVPKRNKAVKKRYEKTSAASAYRRSPALPPYKAPSPASKTGEGSLETEAPMRLLPYARKRLIILCSAILDSSYNICTWNLIWQ